MEPLCGRGHRLEFTLAGGDGPDYPGEFVGDSNRGFVVSPRAVDLPRPGAELVGRALADVGRSEHGASALREERTEVGVATLGDAPEAANVTCAFYLFIRARPVPGLPPLSVGEMTLRLYGVLSYSQNSARDLRCALNGA